MEKNKIKVLVVCKDDHDSHEGMVCKLVKKEGFEFLNAWKNNLKKSDLENVDFVISIEGMALR